MHLELIVNHGHRIVPHLAGTNRMISRLRIVLDPFQQIIVGRHIDTRRHLVAGHVLHRTGVHDPPRYPHRFEKNIPVTLRRQEVETDCGRLARIIRRDMYAPGTV